MRLKCGFSLFLVCLICCLPAYSAEPLRFQKKIPPKDILKYISLPDQTAEWEISEIDLNNDGLEEKVIKSSQSLCNDKHGCSYIFAAQKGREWINLGRIQAFNVLVSDQRTYGIRDLLVYATPNNDFNFERYVWNPRTYKYEEQ